MHEANAGRDSKPVIWIFEGNNVLWIILGFGLALLAFRYCHGKLHWSFGESIAVASIPILTAGAYVIILKSGKPKHFDAEFFEWLHFRARERLHLWGLSSFEAYFSPEKRILFPHPMKESETQEPKGDI